MFKYADYIYEIYKEKSFTKAADNLFISQPALSATVKKAEQNLGIKIFDRSTSKLSLTEFGEEYIKSIEYIKKIEKNLSNQINDISNLNQGNITISAANFIASYIMPEIIMEYSKIYPNINISFIESNSKNLYEKIIDEEIEILIDYSYNNSLCESYKLATENILLAVPKNNKTALKYQKYSYTASDIHNNLYEKSEKNISVNKFKSEKFILLKPGNDMKKRADMIFNESSITPDVTIFLDQLMTSYNMTAKGLGISFVTDTLIKAVPASEDLLFFKLKSNYTKRNLYIINKKNKYLSQACKKFIETATEKMKAY